MQVHSATTWTAKPGKAGPWMIASRGLRPCRWITALGPILVCCLIALAGCRETQAPASAVSLPAVGRLTIITPHNAKIREAFALGFSDWREKRNQPPVEIKWIVRGTPQCVKYVDNLFRGVADGRDVEAPDLMFGGGVADHMLLASRGYSMPVEPAKVSETIPAEIHNQPTCGASNEWHATGLSSFGIVYNARDCALRGIDPPATWADLADPRFFGWVGLASPEASGSNREAMVFILQNEGWDQGWATLLRILGNTRALDDSSGSVLDQVERGVFLAAFAVNFDGMARSDASAGRVVYLNPDGATAATPDITSVLKSARDVAAATDFVGYCLSEPGQVTWGVRANAAGSNTATLYHYPIDPAVYEKYADSMSVRENPIEHDLGLRIDPQQANRQAESLVLLVHAATGDNHVLLQQAWAAVIASGMKADALAELIAPPLGEDDAFKLASEYAAADPAVAAGMLAEWSATFASRYQRVRELLGQ